jgi:GDPmannose 4,6-dehydratase
VRELVDCAFAHVGLDWQDHVRVDPALRRGAAELHRLVGDPTRAQDRLGWRREIGFEQLVHRLVDADVELVRTPAGQAATSIERR